MAEEEAVSDDSSFYGGEEVRHSFELRASDQELAPYWATHHLQPAVIAFRTHAKVSELSESKVHNYYEGNLSARQLAENVDEFLARLPPLSTKIADAGPWVYIADPVYKFNVTNEDLRGFKAGGDTLLTAFNKRRCDIEGSAPSNSTSALGRKLGPLRRQLESDIYSLAREKGILSGKWMFFPSPTDVNVLWGAIAHATEAGELGQAAKVATDDGTGNHKARLVCVYTQDFGDRKDVKRVLQNLNKKGLVRTDRPVYYKADALTHLDINSGNEWGLKPSLYGSKDVLKDDWSIS